MGNAIKTVGDRKKLQARREPYWDRIEAGCFLGYRKLEDGTGTWIARWRNEEGAQKYHALGSLGSYDDAAKAARDWFDQCRGGSTEVVDVEEACKRYVTDRRTEKGESTAKDAEGRFKRLVYGIKFGRIKLSALRTAHITDWRNAQVECEDDDDEDDDPDADRRAKDSANRNLATLKAALNLAYRMGLVASTAQWDRVEAYKGVSKRRDVSLTMTDRKKLIAAATPDLTIFMQAMLLTGCRPGELASCTVGDLDPAGMLTVTGKTGRRTIPLSPKALALLKLAAGQGDVDEPLLTRSGVAWTRFEWRDAFQEARKAAGLPETVVMYSLRHVAISEMLVSGMDPMTVAKIAGTSIEMISRHYGHLIRERVVAQLAKVKAI
ncbi:Site-specific recombinase XerD [Aromatoleum tolulyticum]|uniref:Site-specific recombinase XerD n=1 Tax=Aromatoleum tolulyticum TaxID=34027 RepID=A0A1N6VUQ9_9RHOO|nr:tyrosine-type recombinase/integrase [Aromatoleum tolulyticum]SIQ81498.1 Site-specific recombinase XerD [Aromatoleum tolulyticum]